jgi:hypothetical protein
VFIDRLLVVVLTADAWLIFMRNFMQKAVLLRPPASV